MTEADASVASTSRVSRESGYTYILANGGTLSLTSMYSTGSGACNCPSTQINMTISMFCHLEKGIKDPE